VIQSKPIIVKIVQPEDPTGLSQLAHVIYNVFGLVGVIIILVCILGLGVGSFLFWIRRRSA
jgi:uncharacterized membrane protein YkvI